LWAGKWSRKQRKKTWVIFGPVFGRGEFGCPSKTSKA